MNTTAPGAAPIASTRPSAYSPDELKAEFELAVKEGKTKRIVELS